MTSVAWVPQALLPAAKSSRIVIRSQLCRCGWAGKGPAGGRIALGQPLYPGGPDGANAVRAYVS